jgi:hypothetical protein
VPLAARGSITPLYSPSAYSAQLTSPVAISSSSLLPTTSTARASAAISLNIATGAITKQANKDKNMRSAAAHVSFASEEAIMGRVTRFAQYLKLHQQSFTNRGADFIARYHHILVTEFNRAVVFFNSRGYAKQRSLFPLTADGAAELLACMAKLRLCTLPDPPWIQNLKGYGHKLRYSLMWNVYYMTDLPVGILPEQIITGTL